MTTKGYYDAFEICSGRWLCCVLAEDEEDAKTRASEKSGVAVIGIRISFREGL